jgi:hypothetical protein
LDAPLLLFLVTGGSSLAAAYDPGGTRAVYPMPVGWEKLWGLALAALIFYAVASLKKERERRSLMWLLSGLGTLVALWYITTTDWGTHQAVWTFIPRLGQLAQSTLWRVRGPKMNSNLAGGMLAVALPMHVELMLWRERSPQARSYIRAAWGLASAAFSLLALLLTGSRGAWLGFAAAVCLAGAWWLAGRATGRRWRPAAFLGLVAAGALVGGLVLSAVPQLWQATVGTEAAANRLRIFSQATLLLRDYAFTGCGLGQFPLVHSTYAVLIHVPMLVYAHATPLAVAVEQGLPGAVTLLAVWAGAAWLGLQTLAGSAPAPMGLRAGLLALAVLVTHGVFDNVIYGTWALPLLWLPVGLIVAASRGVAEHPRRAELERLTRRRWCGVAGTVAVALIMGVLFRQSLTAGWQANLGAVHQTLPELRAYDWHRFDDPTLDEVRRQQDLSVAARHYERALTIDPEQVTARTRLAQIALARGAYEEGLAHAEAAWQAGYRDEVTRLLLGDALVAQGRLDEAVDIVRGLEWAETRLKDQAFFRYWRGEDWQRAVYAYRTLLHLDPEDKHLRQRVELAEERMAAAQ